MEEIIIINMLQPNGDTVSVEIENILTVWFDLHYQVLEESSSSMAWLMWQQRIACLCVHVHTRV